jgi:predicted nuclease of restriction endonuclease-like (RecB) superfamily
MFQRLTPSESLQLALSAIHRQATQDDAKARVQNSVSVCVMWPATLEMLETARAYQEQKSKEEKENDEPQDTEPRDYAFMARKRRDEMFERIKGTWIDTP